MKAQEIRQAFLEFFADRGHTVKPSDGLIPASDPTLLFTSAGMVQFKHLWTTAPLEYKRAASVQKCLRVGGKDSDLENVGKTLRHHSFFEMLGNFSFGDYFKREAIDWAWEFIIDIMSLEPEHLWVSVYQDDDEAYDLWKKRIGIPAEKIIRLGEKDNFWGPAGSSGPCGPCSEIYFDRGEEWGCGRADCRPGCDCERYFEFWNLVFPQFYQEPSGERRALERRGIDTGMGLERLALLAQNADSNYRTDLFIPIIDALAEISKVPYGAESLNPYHVIADHIRALTFTVSENILPSNEGRGYVVRRLLRRAVRFGRKLGLGKPFLYRLVPAVVEVMKEPYPELLESREHVGRIILAEEERFGDTLTTGLEKLDEIAAGLRRRKKEMIPGEEVFKLYDTYGFPPELTDEVVQEKGLRIDWDAFKKAMEAQRERGRAAWKGMSEREVLPAYRDLLDEVGEVKFVGYARMAARAGIRAILRNGEVVDRAAAGDEVEIILDQTPFYAEAGGQVGDSGLIQSPEGKMEVAGTVNPLEGLIVHKGKLLEGVLNKGDGVEALLDQDRRRQIQRHHTATHLLQHALREVLGEHVSQAGSFVGPDYFRFDFTHFEAPTAEELSRVEGRVNEMVIADDPVKIYFLSLEEAKKQGALAFFGEKYGAEVRMIDVGGYSRELCGGTHVERTGEIGIFIVNSESSVASGVRRIEAVCGEKAYRHIAGERALLKEAALSLKTAPEQIVPRLEKMEKKIKELENEKAGLLEKQAATDLDRLLAEAAEVEGIRVVAANLGKIDVTTLRTATDSLKQKMGSGIVVLGSASRKGAQLVAGVTPDLVKKGHHAGEIIKMAARIVGGSGGGRADLAQAGGKEPEKLNEALSSIPDIIRQLIKLQKK